MLKNKETKVRVDEKKEENSCLRINGFRKKKRTFVSFFCTSLFFLKK